MPKQLTEEEALEIGIATLVDQMLATDDESARLRAALAFYADPTNFNEDGVPGRWEVPGIIWTHDGGRTAREALGIPEPEEDPWGDEEPGDEEDDAGVFAED